MKAHVTLLLLFLVLSLFLMSDQLFAQESIIDTFKINDVVGNPGDIIAVKLFVVNDSASLGAFTAAVRIDTNYVRFIGEYDYQTNQDGDTVDTIFFVDAERIERASSTILPNLFDFVPLQGVSRDSVTAAFAAAGTLEGIPIGRGNIMQFFLEIKSYAPPDLTPITLFHRADFDPFDPFNQYSDELGENPTIIVTNIAGVLDIGGTAPTNSSPTLQNPAQSVYNIDAGENVTFNLTATDPDAGDIVTISAATALPFGASFGTGNSVTGATPVAGTFSWTPTSTQQGTYNITFACADDEPAFGNQVTITITVGGVTPPPPGDLLYSTSSKNYGIPSGGIAGSSGHSIPINLNSTSDVYGLQFDFLFDQTSLAIDSITPTDRLTDFTIYDDIGTTPGNIRIVAFALDNQTIQVGLTSAILDIWVSVKPTAQTGEVQIRFDNAWEAISADPIVPSVELDYDSTAYFVVDKLGDVNGDGRIDIADIVIMVGYIIGDITFSSRQFTTADMDLSGIVDVLDLQTLINTIFGGANPVSSIWDGPLARLWFDNDGETIGDDGIIEINADLPTQIAGVELEIEYNPERVEILDPQLTNSSQDLNMKFRDDKKGHLKLVIFPGSGETYLSSGSVSLLNIPVISNGFINNNSDIKITSAILADPNATEIPVEGLSRLALPTNFSLEQNYPNPFNPETKIDFYIRSDHNQVHLDIFNILGRKVKTIIDEILPAGAHSVTWDGTDDNGLKTATGVYFYRLQVGELQQTKKMVMLK